MFIQWVAADSPPPFYGNEEKLMKKGGKFVERLQYRGWCGHSRSTVKRKG